MSQYAVPLSAFEAIRSQVGPGRLGRLNDEIGTQILTEITRRQHSGQGFAASFIAEGLDFQVASGVMWITSSTSEGSQDKRRRARLPWRGRQRSPLDMALSDVAGPEWVYPGDAANGLYRDAIQHVILVLADSIVTRVNES